MSYHGFDNLAEFFNGDLSAKIGRGIFSKDLIDRKYNCSFPSKVKVNCVYEGKCRSKCKIHKVKCSLCDAIFIGNTRQTFKKRMEGNFSYLLHLLLNRKKLDSFADHFKQHYNATTSRTYLHMYMKFKVVKRLNPISTMEKISELNCNLCMEERLTILKKQRDKRVIIMKNNSEIYGDCQHKTNFR